MNTISRAERVAELPDHVGENRDVFVLVQNGDAAHWASVNTEASVHPASIVPNGAFRNPTLRHPFDREYGVISSALTAERLHPKIPHQADTKVVFTHDETAEAVSEALAENVSGQVIAENVKAIMESPLAAQELGAILVCEAQSRADVFRSLRIPL
jgi:hypothetical protein